MIPIDDSLLYVEPLYLRAEKRELPELKRVIASAGDRVVMSQYTDDLFASLFTRPEEVPPAVAEVAPPSGAPSAPPPSGPGGTALQHYRQALDALQKGDWHGFGDEMDALKKALEGEGGNAAAPPG